MNHADVVAAVAQGWCDPTTSDKVMDVVLALAIVKSIERMLMDETEAVFEVSESCVKDIQE